MKQGLLMLGFVFVLTAARAQGQEEKKEGEKIGTITGKIIDSSSRSSLPYATVALYSRGNPVPIDGTTTNNSGHFQLVNIGVGTYTVVAECIGYRSFTSGAVVVAPKSSVIDLKTIFLVKKEKTLERVVVTAQAKVIEQKIDKMVFNVEKDLSSQTGVATDVLRKIPQVSVDVDGNVELAGSSSIRFLINGKPSSAFGSNIAEVLQSIPASQIKSIEVITNPGARYDAEGIGGIINIILKKSTARGIHGNVALTAGTRMDNGSVNFNARRGKLGFNAFVGGNLRPYATTPMTYDRLSTDSAGRNVTFHQEGDSRFLRGGYHSGIGADYTLDEKNSISASLGYGHFGNKGSGGLSQLIITEQGSPAVDSSVASINNTTNKFDYHERNGSLSYKRTFHKEDQELDIAANTSLGTYNISAGNLQYMLPHDSLSYGTNSSNPGTENETEFTVDYSQPLKKDVILGLGGKISMVDISSLATVFSYAPATSDFLKNESLSNSLNYHQRVYALYSEITLPVSKLFDAKIGGRYERTNIRSYYSDAQQKLDIPGYNTFVPSVFLSKKIGEKQQLKLSYSKRIERPDFRDLDPFINTTDPKNITAGNPYLQPEIGNRYEIGYTLQVGKLGSVMLNGFYRTSNHDIQSYLVYHSSLQVGDSTFTNVSVSTRENIGLEKDIGANLFVNLHSEDKFDLRVNFFAFRRHTLNAIDPGFNSGGVNIRTNLNATYKFNSGVSAEFFGNFSSARHELQGTYPSFISYSFAVRKQFWHKNGSLALTAVNPFAEYVNQRTILRGPDFNASSTRRIPFRSFGLNFTWKFGKLEFQKDKEDNAPNLNAPSD